MTTRRARAGRLWLVGAGPGDPDLLTVAARRLLDTADVIVHDRLVGDAILATIPPGTPRINVGKTGYAGGPDQAEINRRLVDLVRAGHEVVRLKGGDPFVFGRGAEELIALAAEGVDVRVVPGITSGIAGPAAFGIPVTHRGLAASVAFVTGARAATNGSQRPRLGRARRHRHRRRVHGRADRRIRGGSADRRRARSATPVALISDASLPTQDTRITTLEALAAPRTAVAVTGRATLLVVGDVVSLREGNRGWARRRG